jgi:hypothetical protein
MRPDQVISAIGLHLVNLYQLLLQVIGGEERQERRYWVHPINASR